MTDWWEDYSSKKRDAEQDDANRAAWVLVGCFVAAGLLVLLAKACS